MYIEKVIYVIVPAVRAGLKEESISMLSDGEQNPQSAFCVKMHSNVQLKITWDFSSLS